MTTTKERIAQLETALEKTLKALDFMDSAMGEGTRRGRPIDLLDKRTYQRMTELCIEARESAQAAEATP